MTRDNPNNPLDDDLNIAQTIRSMTDDNAARLDKILNIIKRSATNGVSSVEIEISDHEFKWIKAFFNYYQTKLLNYKIYKSYSGNINTNHMYIYTTYNGYSSGIVSTSPTITPIPTLLEKLLSTGFTLLRVEERRKFFRKTKHYITICW